MMKSLQNTLTEASNKGKDFSSDFYNALAALAFDYEVQRNIAISKQDWDKAWAEFKEKFFIEND